MGTNPLGPREVDGLRVPPTWVRNLVVYDSSYLSSTSVPSPVILRDFPRISDRSQTNLFISSVFVSPGVKTTLFMTIIGIKLFGCA